MTNEAPMPGISDLLPCPFCGGEAEMENTVTGASVRCLNASCGAKIWKQHEPLADVGVTNSIAAWNRRSLSPTGVRVKPLVWGECAINRWGGFDIPSSHGLAVAYAKTGIGTYAIVKGSQGRFEAWLRSEQVSGSYATKDEAKAAAEADRKQRILSEIEAQPERSDRDDAQPVGVGTVKPLELIRLINSLDTYSRMGTVFGETVAGRAVVSIEQIKRERDEWKALATEDVDALQAIGDEFGVRAGENRVAGVRRILTEQRSQIEAAQLPIDRAAVDTLTANFAKALPGGGMDDCAYSQIEDALDSIEAPMTTDQGKWLTLPERIRALSPSSPKQGVTEAPTHRHKKRRSEYALIGIGKMQTEDWEVRNHAARPRDGEDSHRPVDMREVAIYRSVDDGSLWVRPREEFEDGRFEEIASALASSLPEMGEGTPTTWGAWERAQQEKDRK